MGKDVVRGIVREFMKREGLSGEEIEEKMVRELNDEIAVEVMSELSDEEIAEIEKGEMSDEEVVKYVEERVENRGDIAKRVIRDYINNKGGRK